MKASRNLILIISILCAGGPGLVGIVAAGVEMEPIPLTAILRPLDRGLIPAKPEPSTSRETPAETKRERTLGEGDLIAGVKAEVERELAEGDMVELRHRGDWKPVRVATGSEWRFILSEPFRPDTRGNWFPLVVLEVEGKVAGSWRIPFRVDLYRSVFMAYERLGRGEVPVAPAVKTVKENIYEVRGNPIPATQPLTNYELVQPVGEGQLLTWEDVVPRPLIRRGDKVSVVLEKGALTVLVTAQSLEDGQAGDRILLRNNRSRQELTAVVTGPGKAKAGVR